VPGNDLVLPDTYVSREHAKIQSVGGQYIVSDLGSSNGTFVNGQRVYGAQPLRPGDQISFGRTTFTFRLLTAPLPSASVAAFPVQQIAPTMGLVTVHIENVHKVYRSGDGSEVPVLRGVSLQIRQGEFVALVGPSGSGKSTLINMMTGIDIPDSGNVVVHGQTITGMDENKLARWRGNTIGLIFQFFQLLPTLSALENVMLPMDFCNKWPAGERKDRAMHVLSLVGMDRFHDRLPANMSGGQQQRVAIARALANDPPIIIGDEPTGNLDSATAQSIFQLLGQLAQSGKTVAFVTHDPLLARSTPRKIEILDGQVVDSSVAPDVSIAHA
jgi:putative ABC transport system ATP-binding protein